MAEPMTYRSAKSSDLRQGDVVRNHGMRILIDRPIKTYPSSFGVTYTTPGLILNYDEVVADDPAMAHYIGIDNIDREIDRRQRAYCDQDHPKSDADADRWCETYHWVRLPSTLVEHRWTIQGNDYARWSVEVPGREREVAPPTHSLELEM